MTATALLFAAACSGVGPSAQAADELVVSNGTTLLVTLAVNGRTVRIVAAGALDRVSPDQLPPLPWRVEARTATGRLLTSMTVQAGDVLRTVAPDGSTIWRGDAVRVDLSCGRLDLWSGPPLAGPPPGPGTGGDCI